MSLIFSWLHCSPMGIFCWKTVMARALARSIGATFQRVQGTPDLLPTDITGVSYFDQRKGAFVFRQGPIFAQELLVAADIIRSVAVDPTFMSIGVLGLIVLIRTFLSWSLEVEINGSWPWQRARSGSDTPAEGGEL
jgi:hypothetical protein